MFSQIVRPQKARFGPETHFQLFVITNKCVHQQAIQIEGYMLELQQFQNQFRRTMAYYFCINSAMHPQHSVEQFQGNNSNIAPLFNPSDGFMTPLLYAISWPHNELFQPKDSSLALINTAVPEDVQNASEGKFVSAAKQKKRGQKTSEKQALSAKKNSQSNIINQLYSLFSSPQRSTKIVQSCCKLMGKNLEQVQQILSLFYMSMRVINSKRGRKYVNLAMLLQLFSPQRLSKYLPEVAKRLQGCQVLNLEQLCQIFRRCSRHCLQNISTSAVLTSRRISGVAKQLHLKKLRKLRTILQL